MISNDNPEKLREYRDAEGLTMPLLVDPGATTIKAYGVYNEASERVIPHPTALIIDKEGMVRYVRVDENYRERPSVEELREALAGFAEARVSGVALVRPLSGVR